MTTEAPKEEEACFRRVCRGQRRRRRQRRPEDKDEREELENSLPLGVEARPDKHVAAAGPGGPRDAGEDGLF